MEILKYNMQNTFLGLTITIIPIILVIFYGFYNLSLYLEYLINQYSWFHEIILSIGKISIVITIVRIMIYMYLFFTKKL